MKKILLGMAAVMISITGGVALVWAAYNDVQFTVNTNVTLADAIGSTVIVVTSTSNVASFSVAPATITIGVGGSSASTITLQSASTSKRFMTDSLQLGTYNCGATTSSLFISSSAIQSTIVSLGDYCIYNLGISNSNPNQLALTWIGSSTAYTVTNLGSGVTSSASTASFTATGLTCGTTYTFTVKGTSSGINSNIVTSTQATQLCPSSSGSLSGGGGGGLAAPAPAATTTASTSTTATTSSSTLPISTTTASVFSTSTPPAGATSAAPASGIPTPPASVSGSAPAGSSGNPTPSAPGSATPSVAVIGKPDSTIVIKAPPAQATAGGKMSFSYQYQNSSNKPLKFTILRQLINSKGKIVQTSSSNLTLKAGQTFKKNVVDTIGQKVAPGLYQVRIRVLTAKGNKVLDENNFMLDVAKAKAVVKVAKPAKAKKSVKRSKSMKR